MKSIGNKNSNDFWEYSLNELDRPDSDDDSYVIAILVLRYVIVIYSNNNNILNINAKYCNKKIKKFL